MLKAASAARPKPPRSLAARPRGKDGVYAAKGCSRYLYARDVKGWRDMSLWKFEETDARNVTIENAHHFGSGMPGGMPGGAPPHP